MAKKYTDKQEQQCIDLLLRTKLREGEDVIDNSDVQIAKEVNLKPRQVGAILNKYLNNKN